jgi:putative transposase
MCRGNNEQVIFNAERDKLHYYSLIQELKEDNKITIYHYCFMDNHLHLVVWLVAKSKLSKFMKQLNLRYFNYYKKMYGYSGHLWQGRFKSNIIDTNAYLLQCGKYIELNPVRAGIVNLPEEYRFSSYNYYAKGSLGSIITSSPVYIGLSNSEAERRKQYVEFVVDSSIINTERLVKHAFIGSEAFVKRWQEYYGINNKGLERGRPKKK